MAGLFCHYFQRSTHNKSCKCGVCPNVMSDAKFFGTIQSHIEMYRHPLVQDGWICDCRLCYDYRWTVRANDYVSICRDSEDPEITNIRKNNPDAFTSAKNNQVPGVSRPRGTSGCNL